MTGRDTEGTISAREIASALGIGPPAVSNWRRRHPRFPRPVIEGAEERFSTREIAEWLKDRKISANQRSSTEFEGATYFDRFHRRYSGEVTDTVDAWPRDEFHRASVETSRILRAELATDRACEVFLALLWVLVGRRGLWDRLRSGPEEAPELLAQVDLSVDAAPRLPLLADTTREAVSTASWHQLVRAISGLEDLVPEADPVPESVLIEHVDQWLSEGRSSDHIVPVGVAELMVKLADPAPGDMVVDPFSRAGELLAASAAHGRRQDQRTTLLGRAASPSSLRISCLVSLLSGADAEIGPSLQVQDLAREPAAYDVIVVNPPFNQKPAPGFDPNDHRWRYGGSPKANLNFAWLQGVVSGLRPGGRAVILTSTNTVQSRSSAEKGIRQRMVADGVVEAVVALPDRLFASTAIPTCLWLLRAPGGPRLTETLFVDATTLGSIERRGRRTLTPSDVTSVVNEYQRWRERSRTAPFRPTDGFSGCRPVQEIAQGHADLNPRVHVASPTAVVDHAALRTLAIDRIRHVDHLRADTRRRQTSASTAIDRIAFEEVGALGPVTTVMLGSVCDVLSGPGNITATDAEPAIPIVSPRNIGHNTVSDTTFTSASDTVRRDFERYLLAPGDIVGVRSGNVGRFGLFVHRHTPWLLGSGCLRIRPDTREVDPAFLVHLLGTEALQDWIHRRAAGSVLATISADGIRELPLSLPSLDEQRRMGEILLALDEQTLAHERAAQESAELAVAVAEALTSGAVGLHSSATVRHGEDAPTLEE